MANVTYREEGYDGRGYTIVEYRGPMCVYIFKGYLRGNVFHCYPFRSLIQGEKRNKMTLSVSEVRRA